MFPTGSRNTNGTPRLSDLPTRPFTAIGGTRPPSRASSIRGVSPARGASPVLPLSGRAPSPSLGLSSSTVRPPSRTGTALVNSLSGRSGSSLQARGLSGGSTYGGYAAPSHGRPPSPLRPPSAGGGILRAPTPIRLQIASNLILQRPPSVGSLRPSLPLRPASAGGRPLSTHEIVMPPLPYVPPEGRPKDEDYFAPPTPEQQRSVRIRYPCSGGSHPDQWTGIISPFLEIADEFAGFIEVMQVTFSRYLQCWISIVNLCNTFVIPPPPERNQTKFTHLHRKNPSLQEFPKFKQQLRDYFASIISIIQSFLAAFADFTMLLEGVWRLAGGLLAEQLPMGFAPYVLVEDPEGPLDGSEWCERSIEIQALPNEAVAGGLGALLENAAAWSVANKKHETVGREVLQRSSDWLRYVLIPLEQRLLEQQKPRIANAPGCFDPPPPPSIRQQLITMNRDGINLGQAVGKTLTTLRDLTNHPLIKKGVWYNSREAAPLWRKYNDIHRSATWAQNEMTTSIDYFLQTLKETGYLPPQLTSSVSLPPHRRPTEFPSVIGPLEQMKRREAERERMRLGRSSVAGGKFWKQTQLGYGPYGNGTGGSIGGGVGGSGLKK